MTYPSLPWRLYSVWYRHLRVYTKNLASNGLPPFLEPVLFLVGIGLGLGTYITESMEGMAYIEFLGDRSAGYVGDVHGDLRMHLWHVHPAGV